MKKIIAALVVCLSMMCLTACVKVNSKPDISQESAKTLMLSYLEGKGFDESTDILSEGETMDVDGVKVYVFSWRIKEGDNADKLFGMYAVSFDGKNYYEYQPERDEWIRDMNA